MIGLQGKLDYIFRVYELIVYESNYFLQMQVGLRHKINDDVMIYPGYIPGPGVEPLLMHYGLPFQVGGWRFAKLEHHEDDLVYICNRLFPPPPFPHEVNPSSSWLQFLQKRKFLYTNCLLCQAMVFV